MTDKIKVISIRADKNQVAEVINEAIEMKFEEIIILGFKDNRIFTKRSKVTNALKTIGALELAKHDLMKD